MHRLALITLLAACASTPARDAAQPTQASSTPPAAEPAATPGRSVTATSYFIPEPGGRQQPPMISGKQAIAPDEATIQRASVEYARLLSSWKVCIDETGSVSVIEKLRSSGFPDYDATIRRELAQWKYQPLQVDGKPTSWCKGVSLVYELPAAKN